MSTIPVHFQEVIRFYERVNKLRNATSSEPLQTSVPDSLNISAEAKKRLVMDQARNQVLARIKK